ncbi:MAG: 6-carboxytetrahydropterin synthase [Planctomycetota bacterium]
MIVRFARRYHLNAAHRLFHPDRDDEWNESVFGKCSNEEGHGHNYELEVTLRGEPDKETGMVYPLNRLDAQVKDIVLERFDHRSLNVRLELSEASAPTSEVFLVEVWELLSKQLDVGQAELVHLKLWETPRNMFEYAGARAK